MSAMSLLLHAECELLSILQTVLLQVVLQVHVRLGNMSETLYERQHVVGPDASDRLIGSEVRLLALPVFLTFLPKAGEQNALLLVHQHALPVFFVLLEHSDIALQLL